jgi:hypothetical protein
MISWKCSLRSWPYLDHLGDVGEMVFRLLSAIFAGFFRFFDDIFEIPKISIPENFCKFTSRPIFLVIFVRMSDRVKKWRSHKREIITHLVYPETRTHQEKSVAECIYFCILCIQNNYRFSRIYQIHRIVPHIGVGVPLLGIGEVLRWALRESYFTGDWIFCSEASDPRIIDERSEEREEACLFSYPSKWSLPKEEIMKALLSSNANVNEHDSFSLEKESSLLR